MTQEGVTLSRVIANLTHELKTPLHAMLALAQLLQSEADGKLSVEQHRQVNLILKNGEQLLELITDLLHYSSVTSKARKVSLEVVSVSELLESLLNALRPVADKLQVNVEESIESVRGEFVTDRILLRQIIHNLLSNAVKFTPPTGTVSLHASFLQSGALLVEVSDSGIGIPVEAQKQIFSDFYQVDHGDNRKFGGVGLGLALVRSAVELLGGQLELSSEPGKGSLFRVTVPSLKERLESQIVLVSDPDKSITLSLMSALDDCGFQCIAAPLWEELQTRFSEAALVVADVSDSERIRAIGQLIQHNPEVAVIALSPFDSPELRSEAATSGIAEYLIKPFNIAEIVAKAKNYLNRHV